MALKTTNYGLIKPELTDAADISAFNSNWDKIDEQLKKAGETGGSDLGATESATEIDGDDVDILSDLANFRSHVNNKQNPHNVTPGQIGAVSQSDIVDNLQSNASNLPLSAKQGKLLANASKAAISAKGSVDKLTLSNSVLTKVQLDTTTASKSSKDLLGRTTLFELTDDGGIKCPHSGFVLVSGCVYINGISGTEMNKRCYVKHKAAGDDGEYREEVIATYQSIREMGATGGLSSGTTIIPVNDNDIFYLYAQCSSETTCDTTHDTTYLSVMYI